MLENIPPYSPHTITGASEPPPNFFQLLLCTDNGTVQPRSVLTDDSHRVSSTMNPEGLTACYSRGTRALPK